MILVNKVVQNPKLPKNDCNKNMHLNYWFFIRTKFRKMWMETSDRGTGKYSSEELILASTNPLYDKRFFMELP